MSVTELHPEDLFDKLTDGTLSDGERERLTLHLRGCEVCRFEHGARVDFQREAAESVARITPSLPLLPPQLQARPRRRRPRILVWGVAAAALISASGALASALGEPPWRAVAALFRGTTERTAGTRPARIATNKPSGAGPALTASALKAEPQSPELRESDTKQSTLGAEPQRAGSKPSLPGAEPRLPQAEPNRIEVKPRASDGPAGPSSAARAAATSARPSEAARLAGEAPTASAATSAAQLFAAANQARRAGEVGRASGLYHLLQEQYPGSSEAELSRVTLATLLLNGGDATGALSGFERYLAGPSHLLEAEALVGRARALERLGRRQLAVAAWREVERRLPGSVYARQATERLTALGSP
jgi:TolA-binding protein